MKVDDLYMDNLLEYVFDDNLFVTYKFISVKLKVHVNLAKQMLYHFYATEKAKGKKICATYYLSGMAPQKWISTLNNNVSDDKNDGIEESIENMKLNPTESYGDRDAYLVMLCKDFELEEMKQKFTRLYSVHVYGLSSSSRHTLDMLNNVLEEPLRDDDGNSPVHYGPISCKAAFEYREDPRLAPLLKTVQEVKASVELAKTKENSSVSLKKETNVPKESAEVPLKSNKNERTTSSIISTTKKPSATESNSEDKSRLKNMFAAAASRPKPKPKPAEESNKSSSTNTSESSNSKNKPVSKKQDTLKRKQSKEKEATRKRKRIRDVFSSSDEEEEESNSKMSSDEEDGLPESPVARKKLQIDSDSDEDFKPAVKKSPSPPPPPVISSSGKKRVSKTLPKRHVDEQGFLVTVMTQVMVSEDDQSDEDSKKEAKVDQKSSDKQKEKEPTLDLNRNGLATGAKKEVASKKAATGNPPKKQATLMSFFQKK